jgi:hypothetical protein
MSDEFQADPPEPKPEARPAYTPERDNPFLLPERSSAFPGVFLGLWYGLLFGFLVQPLIWPFPPGKDVTFNLLRYYPFCVMGGILGGLFRRLWQGIVGGIVGGLFWAWLFCVLALYEVSYGIELITLLGIAAVGGGMAGGLGASRNATDCRNSQPS